MIPLLLILACAGDDSTPTDGPETADTGTPGDGSLSDPLSMPAEPTLETDAFNSAEACQSCHPDQYSEWRTSMHAYAMVDPLFQRLVELRQADLAGREDRFCVQCHSAIGVRGGEVSPGFSFDALSPVVMEGITCESCHKVSGVERDYNSGHVLDPDGPMRSTTANGSTFHESEADGVFAGSEFCGACHDVIEVSGLDLERPYREWRESPSAEEGVTCQDCHMPTVVRAPADNVAPREVRQHRFVGVDVPLIDGWITPEEEQDLRANIQQLLSTSAALRLDAPPEVPHGQTVDVVVTVENKIPAHNLPTGSTFLRQVWVELVATDGAGNVLFVTGDLDDNGDLRDYWSDLDPYGDHDLISLSSNFVDPVGSPTLFSWVASEHTSGAISPLYERSWTLFVPTELATNPTVTIEARLRFRALPPYLLRMVGMTNEIAKLEIYDLASESLTVGLLPPQ
ncbi:MAG TPA: hypothetical protein ENK18_10290 [Deltaproteobacteria bacterium]|nr:hypothetical protein [Deltaproteobacteria bacterium]